MDHLYRGPLADQVLIMTHWEIKIQGKKEQLEPLKEFLSKVVKSLFKYVIEKCSERGFGDERRKEIHLLDVSSLEVIESLVPDQKN